MKKYTIYAEVLEEQALEQFNSAMALDCVVRGALMPDAHVGYSLPIGAVIATKDWIFPSWVGFDIGCGMCAVHTGFTTKQLEPYKEDIFSAIYRSIPMGMGNRNKDEEDWDHSNIEKTDDLAKIMKDVGLRDLCSLGGGNHFIEIGYDENDWVWIIIHSGSRGVGHKTATKYMKLASDNGKAKDGNFGFHVDSENGKNYIKDMNFCLKFALENRKRMIKRVYKEICYYITGKKYSLLPSGIINRNHNHADYKNGMWIHRKGATHAEEGMLGAIPGNMRDGSFIVIGKGNPESLWSSSHGAGRVMSRKVANEKVSMDEFAKEMRGITAKVEESTKDESPFAYKNIFEVMELQKDLVEVIQHIKPLINIKA